MPICWLLTSVGRCGISPSAESVGLIREPLGTWQKLLAGRDGRIRPGPFLPPLISSQQAPSTPKGEESRAPPVLSVTRCYTCNQTAPPKRSRTGCGRTLIGAGRGAGIHNWCVSTITGLQTSAKCCTRPRLKDGWILSRGCIKIKALVSLRLTTSCMLIPASAHVS